MSPAPGKKWGRKPSPLSRDVAKIHPEVYTWSAAEIMPECIRPPSTPTPAGELHYATQIATYGVKKLANVPAWKPLNTMMGVLSQIDNLLAGTPAAPAAPADLMEVLTTVFSSNYTDTREGWEGMARFTLEYLKAHGFSITQNGPQS